MMTGLPCTVVPLIKESLQELKTAQIKGLQADLKMEKFKNKGVSMFKKRFRAARGGLHVN